MNTISFACYLIAVVLFLLVGFSVNSGRVNLLGFGLAAAFLPPLLHAAGVAG